MTAPLGITTLLIREANEAANIAAYRFPNDLDAARRYFLELLAEEEPDPARFCPTCGADIVGNDPHEPGCEELEYCCLDCGKEYATAEAMNAHIDKEHNAGYGHEPGCETGGEA